jgi:nucleoside-diphosphate-sugar epimerase
LCRKVIEADDGDATELFVDGTQQRGFIYITDVVEGMIRARNEKVNGEPINVGNARKLYRSENSQI